MRGTDVEILPHAPVAAGEFVEVAVKLRVRARWAEAADGRREPQTGSGELGEAEEGVGYEGIAERAVAAAGGVALLDEIVGLNVEGAAGHQILRLASDVGNFEGGRRRETPLNAE